MLRDGDDATHGIDALLDALRLSAARDPAPAPSVVPVPSVPVPSAPVPSALVPSGDGSGEPAGSDADAAVASGGTEEDQAHLIDLVERARVGDVAAFGDLYDHYQPRVHRFLLLRTRSTLVAEDLTSETFLRALRRVRGFRWQGRDFGAWLLAIARNLASDHQSAGSSRLEVVQDDMSRHDTVTEGPESTVMAAVTTEALLRALAGLPREQRTCLELRFLQGRTIAGTADALQRSEGAVKQLQRRAVRNLARRMPADLRD